MTFIKVDKEKGSCTKVDKAGTEKGWLKQGWFLDWLSGILWRKVNKEKDICEKVIKE